MNYPKLDLRNLRFSWLGLAVVGLFIFCAPLGIALMMAISLFRWTRNLAVYGNPGISGDGVFGMLVGAAFLTIFYFGYLDRLRDYERSAPVRQKQHDEYAASLCPGYFKMNFVQKFNSGQSWCRDYPQFDRSHVTQAAKIDSEATGSTAPVSSTTLWK